MRFFYLLIALLSFSVAVNAQDVDELGVLEDDVEDTSSGIKSFGEEKDSWRRNEEPVQEQKPTILGMPEVISNYLTPSAIENLMHPEQVFCYKVTSKPKGYTGYTLDGMAILSFCGTLSKEARDIIITQFFANEQSISTNIENCVIKPQIMLRFIRGVDATDVLLSSPCYSYTIFYAGNVHTYNIAPIANHVDSLINALNSQAKDFTSPALLGQLFPIGVPQNDDQKKLVEQAKGPIKKWEQEKAEEVKKSSGWNKLKFK